MSTTGGTRVTVSRLEAKTVYVHGLDHDVVTATDIRDWLGQLGALESVVQELESSTKQLRFRVVFEAVECAEQAVKALKGTHFKNRVAILTSNVFGGTAEGAQAAADSPLQQQEGEGSSAPTPATDPHWEYVCGTVFPQNRGVAVMGFTGRQLYAHVPAELQFAGPIVPFVESIATKAGVKRQRDEDVGKTDGALPSATLVKSDSVEPHPVGEDTLAPGPTQPGDVVAAVEGLRVAQARLVEQEKKRVLLLERFAFTPLGRVEVRAKQTRQQESVMRAVNRHIDDTVRVDACVELQQYNRYVGDGGVERVMLLVARAIGPIAGVYVTYTPDFQQSLVLEMAHVTDARVLVGLGTKASSLCGIYSAFRKQVKLRKEQGESSETPNINSIVDACLFPEGPKGAAPAPYDPHFDFNLLCQCADEESYMRQYQQLTMSGGVLAAATQPPSSLSIRDRDIPKARTLKECMLAAAFQSGAIDRALESRAGGSLGGEDEESPLEQILSILGELRGLPFTPLATSLSNGDNGAWGCNPSAATAATGFISMVSKAYATEQEQHWKETTAMSLNAAINTMMCILAAQD